MVINQAKTMKIASTLGWVAIVISVLLLLAWGDSSGAHDSGYVTY